MIDSDTVTFAEFLKQGGIGPDDPRIPLLAKCWDTAIGSACDVFVAWEGTDYDVKKELSTGLTSVDFVKNPNQAPPL